MSNIKNVAMITVCGRPNVGKSSLTNALVGEKVAIVSNKAQTTRNRIYGVVNREDTQYILLDTPGLHKPKSALWAARSRHSSTGSGRRRSPASSASTRLTLWNRRSCCR